MIGAVLVSISPCYRTPIPIERKTTAHTLRTAFQAPHRPTILIQNDLLNAKEDDGKELNNLDYPEQIRRCIGDQESTILEAENTDDFIHKLLAKMPSEAGTDGIYSWQERADTDPVIGWFKEGELRILLPPSYRDHKHGILCYTNPNRLPFWLSLLPI